VLVIESKSEHLHRTDSDLGVTEDGRSFVGVVRPEED
jgi:hypothetical protein